MRLEHKKNVGIATYTWLFVIILFCYSKFSFATFRDFTNTNLERCSAKHCWEITGLISRSDMQEFSKAIKHIEEEKSYENPEVWVDSNGGDIEVAIEMGLKLRKFHATILTWDHSVCYSSSIFILAGGVQRLLNGAIGIHRPYSLDTAPRDIQSLKNEQQRIAKLAKDYLLEVNVLPSLYDAMMTIPPENIKFLSALELQNYGLIKIDPIEQEMDDAYNARKYGLSKIDYLRRKAKVNDTCEINNNYPICRDAVFRESN